MDTRKAIAIGVALLVMGGAAFADTGDRIGSDRGVLLFLPVGPRARTADLPEYGDLPPERR